MNVNGWLGNLYMGTFQHVFLNQNSPHTSTISKLETFEIIWYYFKIGINGMTKGTLELHADILDFSWIFAKGLKYKYKFRTSKQYPLFFLIPNLIFCII